MMNKYYKYIKSPICTLSILSLMSLSLSGCLSSAVDDRFGDTQKKWQTEILQEQIISIGITNDKKENLILAGKNYNYVIFDFFSGRIELLKKILTELPPNERILRPNTYAILNTDNHFEVNFDFIYPVPQNQVSKDKVIDLESLQITNTCTVKLNDKYDSYYCITISIRGEVYHKKHFDETQMKNRLKTDIPITIIKTSSKQTTADKIVYHSLMPIAIVVDIALFPFEFTFCNANKRKCSGEK